MTTYRNLADLLRNTSQDVRDQNGFSAPTQAHQQQAQEPAPVPASQSLILPVPPSANRYFRNYRGRTVTSADAKAYKAGVWLVAQHAGLRPYTGRVAMYVRLYRARKAGDLDNFGTKILADALEGIAYQNDKQIVEWHLWMDDDKNNPRVEVEIREVQG